MSLGNKLKYNKKQFLSLCTQFIFKLSLKSEEKYEIDFFLKARDGLGGTASHSAH